MNNKSLHSLIRTKFEGRDFARLRFAIEELTHAWINIPVERMEDTRWGAYRASWMRQPAGYYVGHVVGVIATLFGLAFWGAIAHWILEAVLA